MFCQLALSVLVLAAAATDAQEYQCHVAGQCTGVSAGFSAAVTYNECLNHCRANPNCRWFTHFDDQHECIQFYDSPFLDTSCDNCRSGQVECEHVQPVCNAVGACQGHFVAFETLQSVEECLAFCQSHEECRWYSYLTGTGECQLTEDCIFFDGSCRDCLAGERECQIDVLGSKLFVVGGQPEAAYGSVEVIDLSEENLSCQTPQDISIDYGSVSTFIGNTVMVCGGTKGVPTVTNGCYNYSPGNDSWIETYSMLSPRWLAAAVQLSPTKWWVTGGDTDSEISNSTEIFTLGEGFAAYVDMPMASFSHNLVKVNRTHIILLGGSASNRKAWMFNVDTEFWTVLPDLMSPVVGAAAGLVTNADGRYEIVVAPDTSLHRSQILDLTSLVWRYGPEFPLPDLLFLPTSVPFGDTFLVVGGEVGTASQSTIYKYVAENGGSWSVLPESLTTPRKGLTALLVPGDFIDCNHKE